MHAVHLVQASRWQPALRFLLRRPADRRGDARATVNQRQWRCESSCVSDGLLLQPGHNVPHCGVTAPMKIDMQKRFRGTLNCCLQIIGRSEWLVICTHQEVAWKQ